ncbi:hypothetical protein Clacol_000519 [Clathrus columnatus]|uniref:Homeobox domain-containing protein n=1 Tax=Clathrus columnatus TaxID=1419009 RepID=A0AAV5A123_9AGAM|nr:hypothetical protein Clacol_000519 [Clathrus columnatus]
MNYHHAPPPLYYPYPPHFDGSVNMNNPYIYDPTHVKHRRRTTPEQLKVLEETFKTDPKPNPALRKQLSLRLGMTPRVLQVWFQNRRMKVKRLVKKQTDQNSNSFTEAVSATTNNAVAEDLQQDGLLSSPGSPSSATPGPEISSAPVSASTPTPPSGSPSSSPAPSPSSPSSYPDLTRRSSLPPTFGFNPSSNHHLPFHNFHQPQQQHLPLNHHQHQNMPWNSNINNNNNNNNNHGSATAIRYDATSNSSTGGNGLTFDSLTDPLLPRRRSFTSLHRLDSHPFAPLVAAGNGVAITLPARQNHLFPPLDSVSTSVPSVITANAESLSDIGACTSLSDPSSVNNRACASATISLFSAGSSTDVSCKTTEGLVTGRLTSLKSEDLNAQGLGQNHNEDYRRSSSADRSNIFGSAAPPDSNSKENRLDRSRATAETTLESPAEPEHINRQGHRFPGPPPTADVRSPGSSRSALTLQQPTLPQQRSHSPPQVRTFLKNYHSSSTPTYVTGQAQSSSIMSPMSNNSTHTITHTSMGVVQPGLRSASFHGIISNSDNYHAYYNRQIPAGQGVSVGVGRDIGIPKGSGVECGYQSLSVNYSARGLHSPFNGLQPQVMQAGNRGYVHSGYRSMSSASLLGHSNSLQETGPPTQAPQPYQHHHHGSLPFHPQLRQPESDLANTQPQPPYTFPPRQLGFLLPGPLPAADYSFGTATSNTDSEMRETDEETQDDKQVHTWDSAKGISDITLNNTARSISNASGIHDDKGYESRFGSLASLASMPSVPSVSEGGTSAEWEREWEFEGLRDMGDERRGSCTGQVVKLLSTLEVGSRRGSEESIHSLHSGRLLNVPDGMSTHYHRHDLNEIRQLSYPVPNVDLRRDPEAIVDGNKNEGTTDTAGHADGGFNEKVDVNEQVDDEDQRKTPSASPPMTRSQETKKTYQEMNLYSKGIHGNQILSAYSPLHPGSTHCPASDFYNINVDIENGYDITNQLGVPMNMDMVEIGEPFPFTNANGDYVSGGTNAEDGMFGIERYTETTTTSGPYDGAY